MLDEDNKPGGWAVAAFIGVKDRPANLKNFFCCLDNLLKIRNAGVRAGYKLFLDINDE